MKVKYRGTYRKVASLAEATRLFSAARDASGEGGSTWRDGYIVGDRDGVIARISYNGKIWPNKDWEPSDKPLYDPYR